MKIYIDLNRAQLFTWQISKSSPQGLDFKSVVKSTDKIAIKLIRSNYELIKNSQYWYKDMQIGVILMAPSQTAASFDDANSNTGVSCIWISLFIRQSLLAADV